VRTVVEALAERVQRHADRPALRSGEAWVTYGALWSRVLATAADLSERGVRPGDRVALAAQPDASFVAGYFAVHGLGAVAVVLDPNAPAGRRDEVFARTGPTLALGIAAGAAGVAHAPFAPAPAQGRVPSAPAGFGAPRPEALADLVFTTGTTGRPKGVRLAHRNLAAAAAHINAVIPASVGDVEVVPLPLHHSFGLGRLRCLFAVGGAAVLVKGFRLPGEILAALERDAATGLVGVPAGFAVLLRLGERGLGRFADRLRYVEIGSAPMPLEHKRELMRLLPRTSLFMHYGLTEASRSAFTEFHRDREHLGSAGLPAPGVRVEVRDEAGGARSAGDAGELWIRGDHVSPGYWDDPALDAATFRDGWVRTGDVAHLDDAGRLHLRGRRDDMINAGGFKVAPDEVEDALSRHPAVSEAACVGMPDPRGISGTVIRAFLVRNAGGPAPSDVDLSRWLGERLEAYKVPARYEWVARLPRTESGKLLRASLRDLPTTAADPAQAPHVE
jgi:long-chain acyl-CoA synthetase